MVRGHNLPLIGYRIYSVIVIAEMTSSRIRASNSSMLSTGISTSAARPCPTRPLTARVGRMLGALGRDPHGHSRERCWQRLYIVRDQPLALRSDSSPFRVRTHINPHDFFKPVELLAPSLPKTWPTRGARLKGQPAFVSLAVSEPRPAPDAHQTRTSNQPTGCRGVTVGEG